MLDFLSQGLTLDFGVTVCVNACSSCGRSTGPASAFPQGDIAYSNGINQQVSEQQRRRADADADVELTRKRRELQEEEQRVRDRQSKMLDVVSTAQSRLSEQQRKFDIEQSERKRAHDEGMRALEERIERHSLKVKEDRDLLEAQKRAFEESIEAKQTELQEEKKALDLLWSKQRVRTSTRTYNPVPNAFLHETMTAQTHKTNRLCFLCSGYPTQRFHVSLYLTQCFP